MNLREPWLLLALLPAAAVLALAWRRGRRGAPAGLAAPLLQTLAALALGLAAAGLAVRTGGRPAALVLVDRSASTAASHGGPARAALAAGRALAPRFDVAYASFALTARPETAGALAALPPDEAGTDLAAALGLAGRQSAPGEPAVLVGDGLATVPGARAAALALAGGGPALVVLPAGVFGPDAAVAGLDVPAEARPGAPVRVAVRVTGSAAGPVVLGLTRHDDAGSRELGRRELALPAAGAGAAGCFFDDTAPAAGTVWYTAALEAPGDAEPANNSRRAGLRVLGPVRAAVLAGGESGAGALLAAAGIEVTAAGGGLPARLAGLDAVVIDNLPRERLPAEDCRRLAAFIAEGGGLVVLGGPRAYASGGWHNGGELERELPASMTPPDDRGLLAVLVLDRSGSMGVPLPGGGTKLERVRAAAREMLGGGSFAENDRLAAVAFASAPELVAGPERPAAAEGAARLRGALDRLTAAGSTDLAGALEMAAELLRGDADKSAAHHIIMLSDGLPVGPGAAGQRARLEGLAAALAASGATLSTVGTGSGEEDARLLGDLARLGRGRFYRPGDLAELGEIFRRDLAERRAAVAEGRFAPVVTPTPLPGLDALLPALEKRNRFSAKPGVWTALEAPAPGGAGREPLLLAWERGHGRAVCLGTGLGGAWNGRLAGTPEGAALLGALARWAAGRSGREGCSLRLVTAGQARGRPGPAGDGGDGGAGLRLELVAREARGQPLNLAAPVIELRSADGRWSKRLEPIQESPSRHAAGFVLPPGGRDFTAVARDGAEELARAVFSVPFPPELARVGVDRAALEDLARAAGGRVIASADELRRMEFPAARGRGMAGAAPWLAAAGLLLVLAELALRAARRGS
jgi:Mg-chelatase subunit ChlD